MLDRLEALSRFQRASGVVGGKTDLAMSDVPQTLLSGNGDQRAALVVIFLRGGADGLSLVGPVGDDDYHNARPRLALVAPEAVRLDGFFALNPLLKPLEALYHDGTLAIVHAAGSEDSTRSHFEAQDLMEHGGLAAGGWLGRFLRSRQSAAGALSAIAMGRELPESLRGAPAATVLQSLDDFALPGAGALVRELEQLYRAERDAVGAAGVDTLAALRRIERLRAGHYVPANGAAYGRDDFAQGLQQIARLVKARVGLEAASLDLGGWDSHFTQGTIIDPLLTRLAGGLSAFCRDLGAELAHVTVVVMTEFGRRVRENASFGTDHGRGSVMFVLGGGVKGGRVLGHWPGLKSEALEGPGDLPVTTNYRDVLAPILRRHGATDLGTVFPDFTVRPLALFD
jgi:uncharacterized protein (DUF1501 family)